MRRERMRALVFKKPKEFAVEERPIPEVKEGEVLVQVKYAGVCGTDVRIYNGTKKIGAPRITGHEFAGEVIEIGKGVTSVKVGDRVTVYPMIACNECYACLSGRTNICVNRITLGYELDGGFAEFVKIPKEAVERGNIIKLPQNVSYEEGAVSEPMTAAYHGIERSGLKSGNTVAIIGTGPIGLCHVQLAKLKGPKKIIIVEPDEQKRKLALEFGATDTINPLDGDVHNKVMDLTQGEGVDVVILDVGLPKVIEGSLSYVKKGGMFLLFAGCPVGSSITIDPNLIHYKEIMFTGSSSSSPENQSKVLELLSTGKINLKKLITGTFHLEDWEQAFNMKANYQGLKSVFKIEK
ncbi:MAG: L-iditol 2-dehydrogenase [Petroclostridium sp.]|nr:L-iditol 2-dehydrogenase [Petroclostridium sp.]